MTPHGDVLPGQTRAGNLLFPLASNERCALTEGWRLAPVRAPALDAFRALSLDEAVTCGVDGKGSSELQSQAS